MQEAHRILANYSLRSSKKYSLDCHGAGGAMMHSISELCFSSYCYRKMDMDQARVLYVQMIEDFLELVNTDAAVRPFLHHYPLSIDGIDLTISFEEKGTRNRFEKGFLCYMFLIKENIYYYTRDPQSGFDVQLLKEHYPVAYEKVYGRPWPGVSKYLPN